MDYEQEVLQDPETGDVPAAFAQLIEARRFAPIQHLIDESPSQQSLRTLQSLGQWPLLPSVPSQPEV